MKKENRGGKRKGSGRKKHFNEGVKGIKFMCPLSKEEDFRIYVGKKLSAWIKLGV